MRRRLRKPSLVIVLVGIGVGFFPNSNALSQPGGEPGHALASVGSLIAELKQPGNVSETGFGSSVAVSGNEVIVGAPDSTTLGPRTSSPRVPLGSLLRRSRAEESERSARPSGSPAPWRS